MKTIFGLLIAVLISAPLAFAQGFDPGMNTADQVATTANFTKNLNASDTTVQKALNKLDQMSSGGGSVNNTDISVNNATVNQALTVQGTANLNGGAVVGGNTSQEVFANGAGWNGNTTGVIALTGYANLNLNNTNQTLSQALCLNATGILKTCSSAVGVGGGCTCN